MLARLRRLGAHPRLEPYVSRVLRARLTTQPVRFFLRESRGSGRYRYAVRGNGQEVVLEHGSPDVATFDQTYYQDAHEPPAAAAAALERLGAEHPLRAIDAGANIGMFSVWLAKRFRIGKITAVEPFPRNVAALRQNLALALPPEAIEVVEAAACTEDGPLSFGGADATTGRIGGGGLTVAGRDLFTLAAGADLLKLDIEGAEWPILADPRLADLDVPVVMLEHHPYGAPGGAAGAAGAAEAALSAAGYVTHPAGDAGDGTGVVWGVRPGGVTPG